MSTLVQKTTLSLFLSCSDCQEDSVMLLEDASGLFLHVDKLALP